MQLKYTLQRGLRVLSLTAIIAATPFLTSCDDSKKSSSDMTENTDMTDEGDNNGGDNGTTDGDYCLAGRTFRFISETTTETTTTGIPVFGTVTTTTIADSDLTIAFGNDGNATTTGTVTVTSLESSAFGSLPITTPTTIIDQTAPFEDVCVENPMDGVTYSETIDGVTTTYTLTYTSAKSGTFITTTTGTQISSGATINGTSTGTFEEL